MRRSGIYQQENQYNENYIIQMHEQQNNDQQYENENDGQDQIDYADAFQQARRQQVLRDINQEYSMSSIAQQQHQQVMDILDKRAKRQQYNEQKKKKDEMKRLRQQNALQFFRKIKLQVLINIRNSIYDAKSMLKYKQDKVHKFISCFNINAIRIFQSIMAKQQKYRNRKQFTDLLTKVFTQCNIQLQSEAKYECIWALAVYIGIGFRKLAFIDISDMQLQSFYNLRYDTVKNKKKNISKQIDILRNKLQRKATQQQLKDQTFKNIQQYAFNPLDYKAKSQTQATTNNLQTQSLSSLRSASYSIKAQQIKQMKKNFHRSYCQIYCPQADNWELFNLQTLTTQQVNEMKHSILNNRAIIGFYSVRIIQFNQQYSELCKYRALRNIQIRDQTIDLCDKYENIMKRRHRLGCKALYKNIMREYNQFKSFQMLTQFDRMLIQKQRDRQLQWAKDNFPKSVKQMRISDYFVTPSLIQKYMILKQDAKPIPNIQFHEQKVYYKTDLQRVSARMGWVDENRLVKTDEIPVKTTQNKNKTTTKLYKYCQTQPYRLRIDQNGDFFLDQQYKSIYVPPKFEFPEQYALIPQNVEYLCKRAKYKCVRIVQGFSMVSGHLIPNNIGYLVEAKYKDQIEKIYKERQQKLKLKKQSRKIQNAMTLWRKLFKSIIITQQVHHG